MDARQEFERFVVAHGADISRMAYMMIGSSDEADDLAADVLLAAWAQWDRVRDTTNPMGYLRRMTANMAASRVRRLQLGRTKLRLLRAGADESTRGPDGAGVDVREALARLPPRRRACVVLRFAFDLSEQEVADTLGISVGTVKSQTSKALASLRELLADSDVSDADLAQGLECPGPGAVVLAWPHGRTDRDGPPPDR